MEKKSRGRGVLAVKNVLEADSPQRKGRGRGILQVRSPNTQPIGIQTATHLKEDNEATKSGSSGITKDIAVVPEKDNENTNTYNKYIVMCYTYSADESSPGGFKELSAKKGEYLEFLSCHPDNEHWWKAKNEDGEIGYVPSSYVILKEDQVLPWLEQSILEERERERKERLQRQEQQKASNEGKGSGPSAKEVTTDKPYVYVSAYNRNSANATPDVTPQAASKYYCDVCEKPFNGPKPFKAHMASRSHREEVELRSEQDQ